MSCAESRTVIYVILSSIARATSESARTAVRSASGPPRRAGGGLGIAFAQVELMPQRVETRERDRGAHAAPLAGVQSMNRRQWHFSPALAIVCSKLRSF